MYTYIVCTSNAPLSKGVGLFIKCALSSATRRYSPLKGERLWPISHGSNSSPMSWLKPELTGSPPSGGFHIGFDHRLRLVFAIADYWGVTFTKHWPSSQVIKFGVSQCFSTICKLFYDFMKLYPFEKRKEYEPADLRGAEREREQERWKTKFANVVIFGRTILGKRNLT